MFWAPEVVSGGDKEMAIRNFVKLTKPICGEQFLNDDDVSRAISLYPGFL